MSSKDSCGLEKKCRDMFLEGNAARTTGAAAAGTAAAGAAAAAASVAAAAAAAAGITTEVTIGRGEAAAAAVRRMPTQATKSEGGGRQGRQIRRKRHQLLKLTRPLAQA
jgi:hypothetical protein